MRNEGSEGMGEQRFPHEEFEREVSNARSREVNDFLGGLLRDPDVEWHNGVPVRTVEHLGPVVDYDLIGEAVRRIEKLGPNPVMFPEGRLEMMDGMSRVARVRQIVNCTPGRSELLSHGEYGFDRPPSMVKTSPIMAAVIFVVAGLSIALGVVVGLPALFHVVGRIVASEPVQDVLTGHHGPHLNF